MVLPSNLSTAASIDSFASPRSPTSEAATCKAHSRIGEAIGAPSAPLRVYTSSVPGLGPSQRKAASPGPSRSGSTRRLLATRHCSGSGWPDAQLSRAAEILPPDRTKRSASRVDPTGRRPKRAPKGERAITVETAPAAGSATRLPKLLPACWRVKSHVPLCGLVDLARCEKCNGA
jgi:hypothetical protein